jgi:hypothetical protein
MVFFSSCKKKDPCEEKVCSNPFHVCYNGSCGCPTGYEGDSCNVLSAIKFVGNYQVSETCLSQPGLNYTSNISYGFQDYEVIISNILGSGYQVEASVSGNYISIREQSFGSSRIVGEGTYQPLLNRIQFQYEYNFNGVSRSCTAYFQRF